MIQPPILGWVSGVFWLSTWLRTGRWVFMRWLAGGYAPAQALDAAVTVLAVLGNPLTLTFPSSSSSDLAGVIVVNPAGVRFVDPTGILFVAWVMGFTFAPPVGLSTLAFFCRRRYHGRIELAGRGWGCSQAVSAQVSWQAGIHTFTTTGKAPP